MWTSAILIILGIVCLGLSGWMMYKMIPRGGQPSSTWAKSDLGETTLALSQFILLVAGIVLLVKGVF